MYVSAEGHRNYDGHEGHRLASEALSAARDDADGLERALGADVSGPVLKLRGQLTKLRDTLDLASDADTRRGVSEEARLLRQEVARIRNRPEFVRAAVRAEIDQFVEGFAVSVSSLIDERVNTQIHRLASLARESLARNSPHGVDDARRSLDEIRSILFGALAKLPGFWLARFEAVADDRHLAIDKNLHDQLAREGETAIQRNDVDALREISFRITDNQVQSSGRGGGEVLAGLTRD
jgi:molecular chaperone DnaK